jgi:hypothetical protein
VKYSLNSEFVFDKRGSLLYNGCLYIQKEKPIDTDYFAIELSRLFGEIRGCDDFLISLFDKKTDEKIENVLRAKGIQELPEEEKEWLGIGEAGRRMAEEKEENEQGLIEKKEWQPECRPEEVETNVEEVQFIEKPVPAPAKDKKRISISPEPPEHPKEVDGDVLSQKAKMAIGRWGEEYALKCLKEILSAKYPVGKMEETSDGFTIRLDELLIVEVHWLNATDDKGEGYDIVKVENDTEEYIEVKSTKTDTKDWFEVSGKQWELMKQEGDKFHIYRVYNAGTKDAKLIDICDPYKKWQEGQLNASPIRIQI